MHSVLTSTELTEEVLGAIRRGSEADYFLRTMPSIITAFRERERSSRTWLDIRNTD